MSLDGLVDGASLQVASPPRAGPFRGAFIAIERRNEKRRRTQISTPRVPGDDDLDTTGDQLMDGGRN
jgi:hypothetical protein